MASSSDKNASILIIADSCLALDDCDNHDWLLQDRLVQVDQGARNSVNKKKIPFMEIKKKLPTTLPPLPAKKGANNKKMPFKEIKKKFSITLPPLPSLSRRRLLRIKGVKENDVEIAEIKNKLHFDVTDAKTYSQLKMVKQMILEKISLKQQMNLTDIEDEDNDWLWLKIIDNVIIGNNLKVSNSLMCRLSSPNSIQLEG